MPLAMLIVAAALFATGDPSHWVDVGYRYLDDYQGALVAMENEYGISIKHDDASESLPELWRIPPANGQATTIDDIGLSRYARVLAVELAKYPKQVIAANLETVYLLGALRLFGVDYGGTSVMKSLYLTGGSRASGYDDHYLESLFHHELSSVLFREHDFPASRWQALNPKSFSYSKDDADVLGAITRRELDGSEALYQQGFLAEYGRSTLENDFNLFAETFFVDPQRMRELINEYPAIRKKYQVAKEFYLSVDRNFEHVFALIE